MVFSTKSGNLIEININDYISDKEYYMEIMKLKEM